MSINWHDYYVPPNIKLWQGRIDSDLPERFNQVVRAIDLSLQNLPDDDKFSFVIVGFACDEGVRRNHGRVGAKQGPDVLRRMLTNLPFNYANSINFFDIGNIVCNNTDLETAQAVLGKVVSKILLSGCHPIVLGGGHETAWGHYQGIATTEHADNLGIINFDAHFDLRPLIDGNLGSSGTPFTQIAQSRQIEELPFDYFCLGIQNTANTLSLYDEAEILGVQYISADELANIDNVNNTTLLEDFADFIEEHDNLYVSICLDVFSTSVAPGVSAPQPLGLMPQNLLPFLKLLAASDKVISLDVVELAPSYDHDNITAKLGAQLIAEYIDTTCAEDSESDDV